MKNYMFLPNDGKNAKYKFNAFGVTVTVYHSIDSVVANHTTSSTKIEVRKFKNRNGYFLVAQETINYKDVDNLENAIINTYRKLKGCLESEVFFILRDNKYEIMREMFKSKFGNI